VNPGPARVLEALRTNRRGKLSGAALSASLGVTRTQVWKHVESLRARGYRIDGVTGGGYRFVTAPDRLYPEEVLPGLETRWLARSYVHLESTDSTNRVAFELGTRSAPHGATVVAEGQSAGRGRLGRSFFSPPHVNLYTSILLRPPLALPEAPPLVLAAAVAVAETIAATVGDPDAVAIKWPNDVQLGGRKTSGILMELQAEGSRVAFAVLGIGVNLNVDPRTFPAEFRDAATSVAAFQGRRVDRVAFARLLYGNLEAALDACVAGGFERLRARFEARFHMAGQRVRVAEAGGASFAGVALGIDADGALLVRRDDGATARVIAGDVTLAGEASPA
jgi:BirA family biotin operon repressor/biotin-[acetyl-CoA-carboxylase] ligase